MDCGLTQVAGAPLLGGVHPLNHSGALLGHLSLSLSLSLSLAPARALAPRVQDLPGDAGWWHAV